MRKPDQLNIVLLGPPGAGKGTQAEILKKAFNILHVSTGDILRDTVKSNSPIGKKVSGYMEKGELVPDEIVTSLVNERIGKSDAARGVILDGYPRTRAQAEALDRALKETGKEMKAVLYMRTSEKVAIQRLSGRRVCKKCGKNYHVTNMPPVKENMCDICGGELYQRKDDNPETVKNRLRVYEDSTKDLVEYYRTRSLLREVDGDSSAEKLFEEIRTMFSKESLS